MEKNVLQSLLDEPQTLPNYLSGLEERMALIEKQVSPRVLGMGSDGKLLTSYTLLAQAELRAASQTLATFESISPNYRNLRLVWHGISDRATDAARRVVMRFNNDTANNYYWQVFDDGTADTAINTSAIVIGALNGAGTGHVGSGVVDILNYSATSSWRGTAHNGGYIVAGDLHYYPGCGMWLNSANAINRLDIIIQVGTVQFDIGSTAYLYGY